MPELVNCGFEKGLASPRKSGQSVPVGRVGAICKGVANICENIRRESASHFVGRQANKVLEVQLYVRADGAEQRGKGVYGAEERSVPGYVARRAKY